MPRTPFLSALVMGISLYALPEKDEGGQHYPAVERVHLHVMWFDESGHPVTGTAPVLHPYPAGGNQEDTIVAEALRQFPIGSTVTDRDLSAAAFAKPPERIASAGGPIREGFVCGWFCHYESGKDGEAPFLRRFLVVRRRNEHNQWRTDNVKLEAENEIWPLRDGPLLPQVTEAFQSMATNNEIYAPVHYARSRGNFWQAFQPRIATPARHSSPAPTGQDDLDVALGAPAEASPDA